MSSETRRLNKLKDESRNIAKRYKLTEAAVKIIEKAGAIHGQQSRAIQVAVELLWNSPGWGVKDESMSDILNSRLTGKTYKLPPRTVSLIEALAREYETQGKVLAAIAYILAADASGARQDLRTRLTRMPVPAAETVISYEPVPPLRKGETWEQRVERDVARLSKARATKKKKS